MATTLVQVRIDDELKIRQLLCMMHWELTYLQR